MEPNMMAEEDTQHGRYLTFIIGKETYGLEIWQVSEIVGMQPVTRLPEVPGYIKGIINLRGRIIPVIDVRLRFGLEPKEYDGKTCIIIVNIRDIPVGLIVDIISEVLTIDDTCITPPPGSRIGIQNKYLAGIGLIGDSTALLLNCNELLAEDGMEDLKSIQESVRRSI